MRILWLKTELLHPVDKGGKIRTYHMLRELKRDHRITYLTLDDGSAGEDAARRAAEYCHDLIRIPHRTRRKPSAGFYAELALNLASPLPYFLTRYRSGPMREAIEHQVASGFHDLTVCDFLVPAVNLPGRVPRPSILFQHNVEAVIWRRHYEVARNGIKRAYLREQWRKARRAEGRLCRRFDRVVAVSDRDRSTMEHDYNLSDIATVGTGVDTEYFTPRGTVRPRPGSIVFTGSMDWLPNEDGILWFARDILPRVRARVPEASLTVVGRDPTPSIRRLGRNDPCVTVTGRVPDIRPHLEESAVYVVPLRIAGGSRLKIFEAMAMQRPVVSTTVGAEGLPVRHGEQLLIADGAETFAEAVVTLLLDPARASALAAAAAERVRREFGWGAIGAAFAEICEAVAARRRGTVHSGVFESAAVERG